ncbi:hypothetical protein SBRCBS47491_002090 [Sporothrix bragantina]|uniref:Uncharacterized protein n=1 Tax=Sporothrix bragantina TaxID=671064 RepID=A0ABP0B441_9PEZI
MASQTKKTALTVLALVATIHAAQHDGISLEPPVLPKVTQLVFSGNGCLPGTANATYSGSGTNWSDWIISLHDLNLEAVAGAHGASNRPPPSSTCMIHAELSQTSPGWQLALEAVSIRGYAALSSGSSLSAAASVAWEDAAPRASSERSVTLTNNGTTDAASAVSALLDFSSVPAWSDCSSVLLPSLGNLDLNLTFGVHLPSANVNTTGAYAAFGGLADDGHGEISAAPPAVVQRLQWTWRACTAVTVPMGSTTYLPKPKTTSTAIKTTGNSTTTTTAAWTTTAAKNTTTPAAWTTTASPGPVPPFTNATVSRQPASTTWTTSHVNVTVTKTTSTTTTVTSTSTQSNPSTSEPHWTTTTTDSSPFITGSTYTTSVTGTSFSFSFIDDDPTGSTTQAPPTAPSTPVGWTNKTTTAASWTTSTTTGAPIWANITSGGARTTGTVRPVPLGN